MNCYVVTRVTKSLLFYGVVGVFSEMKYVTEGIKAYEAEQQKENPHFPLTTDFKWLPVMLARAKVQTCYIKGGLDDYHIVEVPVDPTNMVGV